MKTSEITPLSAYKFADLVKEAGFPAVSDDKRTTHGIWDTDDQGLYVGCRQHHYWLWSYSWCCFGQSQACGQDGLHWIYFDWP